MKTIIFSVSFLVFTSRVVRSVLEPNMDYFIMNEAHIQEYRNNEIANTGYPPFYVICNNTSDKKGCSPAAPILDFTEGYAIIKRRSAKSVYYGCPQRIDLGKALDPAGFYKTSLFMQEAKLTEGHTNLMGVRRSFYNIYTHKCLSDVSPVLWRNGLDRGVRLLYGIGFLIPALERMPLAEVYFDYGKRIPIWTKHTLYGVSLAAPIAPFRSIEEIEFQVDSSRFSLEILKANLSSYYKFNEPDSPTRHQVNDELAERGLQRIPETSKIIMGHLVPEYDMVASSWKKVSRFAQTIVPTWEKLYLEEWADVDDYIREVAFMRELTLTVYSGVYGQLSYNVNVQGSGEKPAFYLDGPGGVAVPQLIWKLVIDETPPTRETKRAIVIVFENITKELADMKIFYKSESLCEPKCGTYFRWTGLDKRNRQIYCCTVSEISQNTQLQGGDFPLEVRNTTFENFIL